MFIGSIQGGPCITQEANSTSETAVLSSTVKTHCSLRGSASTFFYILQSSLQPLIIHSSVLSLCQCTWTYYRGKKAD